MVDSGAARTARQQHRRGNACLDPVGRDDARIRVGASWWRGRDGHLRDDARETQIEGLPLAEGPLTVDACVASTATPHIRDLKGNRLTDRDAKIPYLTFPQTPDRHCAVRLEVPSSPD